jgi:hypothetical protein
MLYLFISKLRTKNLGNNEPFFDIADLIMNFKRPEICDMTLDELLDKIGSEGMESLSELERKMQFTFIYK